MTERVADVVERSMGPTEVDLRAHFAGKRSALERGEAAVTGSLGGVENTVWSGFEAPPRLAAASEFHWFHPPIRGQMFLAVLSAEPMGYASHWHAGRMRLCEGSECELCLLGTGRQVRFVVSCVDLRTKQLGFLETGTAGAEVLKRAYAQRGLLKGSVLALSRASPKKQSRIDLEILAEHCDAWIMETEPLDVQAALHQTWLRMKQMTHR